MYFTRLHTIIDSHALTLYELTDHIQLQMSAEKMLYLNENMTILIIVSTKYLYTLLRIITSILVTFLKVKVRTNWIVYKSIIKNKITNKSNKYNNVSVNENVEAEVYTFDCLTYVHCWNFSFWTFKK